MNFNFMLASVICIILVLIISLTVPSRPEHMTIIEPEEWVQHITGLDEDELRKDHGCIQEKDNELIITNTKTKEVTRCGNLHLDTLQHLKNITATIPQHEQDAEIVIITRTDMESLPSVEVSAMQSNPAFANATFLVASNFNGVESVSENLSPSSHRFLTNYPWDKTQGPYASVSAGGAAIIRVIEPFYNQNQPKDKQIEMLANLSDIYPVINGYPMLEDEKAKLLTAENFEAKKDQFIVCSHDSVEAVFKFENRGLVVNKKGQMVHQLFGCALNIGQGYSGYANQNITRKNKLLLDLPLQACYEGLYLKALMNRSDKIVLTFLGGGAFGNDINDIVRNWLVAHNKYKKCTKQVFVPFFSRFSTEAQSLAQGLKKSGFKVRHIEYTNNIGTEKEIIVS